MSLFSTIFRMYKNGRLYNRAMSIMGYCNFIHPLMPNINRKYNIFCVCVCGGGVIIDIDIDAGQVIRFPVFNGGRRPRMLPIVTTWLSPETP